MNNLAVEKEPEEQKKMRLDRELKPCLCGCGHNALNQMSHSNQLERGQANPPYLKRWRLVHLPTVLSA